MKLFKKIITLVLAMTLMTGCSLTNNADSQKVFNFADSGYVTSLDSSKAIDETSTNVIQAFGDGLYTLPSSLTSMLFAIAGFNLLFTL